MQIFLSKIPVQITRKDIKNIRLYVKPPYGEVSVSAPLSIPYDEIEKFVRSKEAWIKTNVQRIKSQSLKAKPKYETGEEFAVWGGNYTLQIKYGERNSLKLTGEKAVFKTQKKSTAIQREKYIRQWYKKQLTAEIKNLLPKWEKKTGLKCNKWNTRYMTSRWGSCTINKRKICINIQLAKKPVQCLEYIILHELLHFEEKYHNDRFYSLMTKYMPNWNEARSILNGKNF